MKTKMETQIEERIEFYADLYNQLRTKFGNADVAVSVLGQIGKDMRMTQIRAWEAGKADNGASDDMPPTTKQLEFMRDLGLEIPADLTKRQASALIDEEKNRRDAA